MTAQVLGKGTQRQNQQCIIRLSTKLHKHTQLHTFHTHSYTQLPGGIRKYAHLALRTQTVFFVHHVLRTPEIEENRNGLEGD